VLFDYDGFDLFMLPFANAVRPAKGNHSDHQQAFDTAAVSEVCVFKVKASAL
jgi:hypothetical protein